MEVYLKGEIGLLEGSSPSPAQLIRSVEDLKSLALRLKSPRPIQFLRWTCGLRTVGKSAPGAPLAWPSSLAVLPR